jgi:hypothetical protein
VIVLKESENVGHTAMRVIIVFSKYYSVKLDAVSSEGATRFILEMTGCNITLCIEMSFEENRNCNENKVFRFIPRLVGVN